MPDTNPRKLPQLQFVESIFYCCGGAYGAASWCRRLNGQDIGLSRQQSGFESRRHHHMPRQLSRQSIGLKIRASLVRFQVQAPIVRSWCNWKHSGLQSLETYVRFVVAAPICSVISAGEGQSYKLEVGGSNPPQSTRESGERRYQFMYRTVQWLKRCLDEAR